MKATCAYFSANNAISAYIASSDCRSTAPAEAHQHGNDFWIAARREDISQCNSKFIWSSKDGTTFPVQYNHWGPKEPNCLGGREACASINKARGSTWNDLICTSFICALCEVTSND